MNHHFTENAKNILNTALEIAENCGSYYIGSEHLLLSFFSEPDSFASKVLQRKGLQGETIRSLLEVKSKTSLTSSDMTPRLCRIIEQSSLEALPYNSNGSIGSEHLLLAILSEKDSVAVKLLEKTGISIKNLRTDIADLLFEMQQSEEHAVGSTESEKKHTASGMMLLQKYTTDLTKLAAKGKFDPIIGREKETNRLIQILCRRQKNNACLIGEPGVGKTAVVEGLAMKISKKEVPSFLQNRQLLQLDLTAMIAGAKYRGEFEERMKGILSEAKRNPSLLLFIDEIHTIIGAGAAEGAVDAANILKPALARGEIQLIGATTRKEYRKYIEKDAALERRFLAVSVDEPSAETAIDILRGLKERYEQHHKIFISDEAIRAAVYLSVRYIPDRYLPDKAIDVLDESASAVSLNCKEEIVFQPLQRNDSNIPLFGKNESENKRPVLTETNVAALITQWTGIPVQTSNDFPDAKLLTLEEELNKVIFGQEEAVSAVVQSIRLNQMGLRDPRKPIGSFLFVGPSGSGKTELAKALNFCLFGDEKALIRLDMSEYMERHSVSRIIGSPPGYVGFEDGGYLTEKIRQLPYSVVLFDEIEKAHFDVLNLLLQVLDDGILTDSKGKTVSFRNSIIILTSNLNGTTRGKGKVDIGFAAGQDKTDSSNESSLVGLEPYLRIEFLNRIDEVITFQPLSSDALQKIAQKLLMECCGRIEKMGYSVTYDEAIPQFLARSVVDEKYGARPLKRKIKHKIEGVFSEQLLSGTITKNDSLRFILENETISLQKF